ncbi:MAG: hypothetical protein HFF44_02515 [Lawsonibacter sp.]|nr:hypothetical protein [Lawsonibacter sp.]
MKKLLLTALITSMLLLPVSTIALADHEEAPVQAPTQVQDFRPGDMPAGMGPCEAMAPALHGMVLAMMNHDAQTFDRGDGELAWECLYNTLSLYGQLDSRSEVQEDVLYFPVETAQDYAAALDVVLGELSPLPEELTDRLTYDRTQGAYQAVCGCDSLSQIQVRDVRSTDQGLQLTGALVYIVENQDLAQFQATLQPRDNMFGYAITELKLV